MIFYDIGVILINIVWGIFWVLTLPFRAVDFVADLTNVNTFLTDTMHNANAFGYYNPPFADFLTWFQVVVGISLFLFMYKGIRFIIRMVRGA